MSATGPGLRLPALPAATRGNPHLTALVNTLLAALPLLFVAVLAWSVLRGPFSALDFRHAYWSGGHRVLAGQSPYAWTLAQLREGVGFVYPALSALIFAPAALLSRSAGAVLFTFAGLCVGPAALALMGVRDWRVYAVALVWLPVCAGWLTANESLFMALGLAAVWHWRDRPGVAGLLTAVMISLKPIAWPLVIWLLATRRWRASAHTLAWGLLLNAVAWWVVGAGELGSYLRAARLDTILNWRLGFGIPALFGHLGATRGAGAAVMIILSAALLAAAVHSGLRNGDELRSLTLAVALAIVSSPLLWSHYLALLLVPLAVCRPRLHWTWGLPVLCWVAPPDATVHLWQAAVFWLAAGVLIATLVHPGPWRGARIPLSLRSAGVQT